MKNLLATSIVALTAIAAEAEGANQATLYPATIVIEPGTFHTKSHRLYFGPEAIWAHADVHYSKYGVDTDSLFGGIRVGYDFIEPNNAYVGIEAADNFGQGRVKVKNHSTHFRHTSKRGAMLANEEIRLGYNFSGSPDNRWIVTPFGGVGGYQYRSKSKYHFDENLFYAAFGLRTDYSVSRDFDIGLYLKALYTFNVKVSEHSLDISRSEHNKWGWQVALPLTWRIGADRSWDIQLQPYVVKFEKTIDNLFVGLRLAAGYSY